MKLTQEQLEDQLLDALLHEQSRSDHGAALKAIDEALDRPLAEPTRPRWRKWANFAVAASIIGGIIAFSFGEGMKSRDKARQSAAVDVQKTREQRRAAQDMAIRDAGKVLATTENLNGVNGSAEQTSQTALEIYNRLEQEKLLLESQVNSLLKYDGDQLIVYAYGLDLPDNVIKTLYPQYQEEKLILANLMTQGLGGNHPSVKVAKEKLEGMRRQLDEGVVNLRATLQAKLAMATDRLKNVDLAKNNSREEAIKSGLDAQDYVDAKRDFEKDQELLAQMKQNSGTPADDQSASSRVIRDQEDKVEERRKVLATIVRTKGVIYRGQDSFYGQPGVKNGSVGDVNEQAIRQSVADSPGAKFPEVASGVNGNGGASGGGGAGHGTGSGIGAGRGFTAPSAATSTQGMTADSRDVARLEREPKARNPRARVVPPAGEVTAKGTQEKTNTERYGSLVDPVWQRPIDYPLSTFSIDVDNASYSNIRRMIRDGQTIPADAVRIEECVNAFDYNYPKPTDDKAFAVHTTLATCPWNEDHLLVKVGIKGREISAQQRPVSNLVFLIDVSGSMQEVNKLPLVKESIKLLLHQLDERDTVSYVVYAGSEGVVLPPTKMTESGRTVALDALAKLEAGGSTNGGSGIKRAYQIAKENFIKDGVNRVILATDGDFNVGVTDSRQLVELVKERAKNNIYLSVLAFGTGNLNDEMLESISKDGNGNHYYIDSIREGRKVFLQRLSGTLITIAKDVKIQIEFNPRKVGSYRLIGYANRVLKNEDFNNDKVDAGDIGAGHTVTAFYEIVPTDAPQPNAGGTDPLKYQKSPEKAQLPAELKEPSDEWLTLKLRHKSPEGDISSLQESVVKGPAARWQESDGDFNFASAVALFGMKLRGMDEARDLTWLQIRGLASAGLKDDRNENRAEFIGLLDALQKRGE